MNPIPWNFFMFFYQIRHLPTNASSFWCYFNEFSAALCFSACFCRKKQTYYSSFYCFCLFVYYFGPEVAKSIKMGFHMKGLSMWCPKIIKNHVLGIYWLMVSLDFWSEKFDPPYCTGNICNLDSHYFSTAPNCFKLYWLPL